MTEAIKTNNTYIKLIQMKLNPNAKKEETHKTKSSEKRPYIVAGLAVAVVGFVVYRLSK